MQRKIFLAVAAAALFCAGYVVAQQKPSLEVRRVVTKLDASGKAVVMIDERIDFAPESAAGHPTEMNAMMRIVGADAPAKGLPPRHPMMHRTRSLDYAVIMSGEIDMLLDDGEVHLKAGDVVVQQATNHAWVNRGHDPCRIAFILMDSQEP